MELKREFQNPKVVAALLIFVLIQLVIVAVGNPAQTMVDARNYVKLAVHAVEAGHLYPTYPDLYGDYLFAPGYVNYLAMWFGAGFSERAPIVVNILFNLGIVVEIFYLGAKAFNRKVGYLAACFFMLSLSTYASVLALLTEQMFTVLAGAGLCLALTNDKRKMVLAGIIIALVISKFSLVQKRALYRDTGVRTLSSFLDRLLLLDAPLSERSRSSISAPSQRLSRYERIDTNDLLRRQIVGHVAGNGAGHQGNAWCVRIAPKMENGKGTAKKRGSRSDGAASGNHDFAGSWARKSSLILLLAHSSFSTSIKESSEYAPSSPASLFSKTMK